MTEANEQEIRRIVQDEILGILGDAKAKLGMKDPTGFAKKALEGLSHVITLRQQQQQQQQSQPATNQ